jgi:hypothetical protein
MEKEKAISAVTQRGNALETVSDTLKDDVDVVMAAITQNPSALQYASPELKDNEAIVLYAVTRDGGSLYYASPELKRNKEIVRVAITSPGGGKNIIHAHPTLNNDLELIMTALNHVSPQTLPGLMEVYNFASDTRKKDVDVLNFMFSKKFLLNIPDEIWHDPKFLCWIKTIEERYIPTSHLHMVRNHRELCDAGLNIPII